MGSRRHSWGSAARDAGGRPPRETSAASDNKAQAASRSPDSTADEKSRGRAKAGSGGGVNGIARFQQEVWAKGPRLAKRYNDHQDPGPGHEQVEKANDPAINRALDGVASRRIAAGPLVRGLDEN